MNRPNRISGRFNELLDPGKPIVWDPPPKYFIQPVTEMAPVVRKGKFFNIPVAAPQPGQGKWFTIPQGDNNG